MIFLWSDTHFGHNKSFIYESRGFSSIEEHDEKVFQKICDKVSEEDELYLLGDIVLGDNSGIEKYLKNIPCKVFIIRGNHDSVNRCLEYSSLGNVVFIVDAYNLKYKKKQFFLCHYPVITNNYDDCDKKLWQRVFCLHGHTHFTNSFEYSHYGCYNISVDAHPDGPISIEEICNDIRNFYTNF